MTMQPLLESSAAQHSGPAFPAVSSRRSIQRPLFWLAAGTIFVSGCMVALALTYLRSQAILSGERLTESFAHAIEGETTRTLQTVDQRLQLAASSIGQLRDSGRLNEKSAGELLREQARDLPYVLALRVTDAQGLITQASDVASKGTNISDRAHFQIYLSQPQTDFHIGTPERIGSTGAWKISATRPLRSADGTFSGIILAVLDPAYFARLWQKIDLGVDGSIVLFRREGVLLMRKPFNDAVVGKNFQDSFMFSQLLSKNPFGDFQNTSPIDGIFRMFSYRTLSAQPELVILVGQPLETILAPWHHLAALAVAIWAAASAAIIFLCVFLSRVWQQGVRTEARSEQMELRFRTIFDAEPECVKVLGSDGALLEMNAAGLAMLEAESLNEVTSRTLIRFVQPEYREAFAMLHRRVMDGSDGLLEFEVTGLRGTRRWLETHATPMRDATGQVTVMLGITRDISQRKRMEQELQSQRDFATQIVETVGQGIVVTNAEGRFEFVNPAYAHLVGYEPATLIGKRPEDMTLPEDGAAQAVQRALRRAGKATTYKSRLLRSDGNIVHVLITAVPRGNEKYFSGSISVITDLTEREHAEAALRASEESYRAMVEWSPEAIGVQRDGKLLYVNPVAIRMFGATSAHELVGKPILDLIHPDFHPAVLARMKNFTSHDIAAPLMEQRFIKLDGTVIDVEVQSTSIIYNGAAAVQIAARDITARKKAESTSASLEAQLRESQKMEAIGTLAGGIAHDFNNVIATILGNTELARQDVSANPNALESLGEIRKAGERARALVQQILSFSRRQPTARRPTALPQVINESARLLRATLPSRLALDVHCAVDVPSVLADATQIEQVIINLVTNAMHAMRGGSGRIGICLDTVQLDPTLANTLPALRPLYEQHPGRTVRLAVSDDGPGMDAATLARIFEPFFTTKPEGEGTGLGLSVVHGIVRTHEGAIVVDSSLGKGTTFTLYLPVTAARADASLPGKRGHAEVSVPVPGAGGGRHILYLDDDESLVFLVKRLLQRRGFRISDYIEQQEALSALRADPTAFDLVVTDYNMPGMSGLDVAREVHTIRAGLPVAVVSGFIDEALRAEAEGAGVCELIFKASAAEELCGALARLAAASSANTATG